MLQHLAAQFGYRTDGGGQHVVLPFEVGSPSRAAHPVAGGGQLTVSSTGDVAGMMLEAHDPNPHRTTYAERLAVWTMSDEQLQALADSARDALAIRQAIRAYRALTTDR